MCPSRQHFKTNQVFSFNVDNGLKPGLDLIIGDGLCQIDLKLGAFVRFLVQLCVIPGKACPPAILCRIKRFVCASQRLCHRKIVVPFHQTDTATDIDWCFVKMERLFNRMDQPAGRAFNLCHGCAGFKNDGELIPAQSTDLSNFADLNRQTLRDFADDHVTGCMAVDVVDRLEPIKVQHSNVYRSRCRYCFCCFLKTITKSASVHQPGQRVMAGILFGPLTLEIALTYKFSEPRALE